jgi:hypothetical protein
MSAFDTKRATVSMRQRAKYSIAEMDFPLISHEAGMDSRSQTPNSGLANAVL